MSTTLTDDEQSTLKMSAFGAVQLLSMTYGSSWSTAKENIAGAKILTGATGLVGEVLSNKQKFKIKGRSIAEIADEVLPALTATTAVLEAKEPQEVQNFRTIVTIAVEQVATCTSDITPAQALMIDKIKTALGETV
jgi:hypothetical protein